MSQLASIFSVQPGYSQIATTALQAANGDFLIAGRLFKQDGPSVGVAARVRADGTPVWEKTYPGRFATFFSAMAALPDGTFTLTGTYFTSHIAGDEKAWMVNLDGAGKVLWEQQYGYPGNQNDGFAVVATSDGGFVAAGLNLEHGSGKVGTTLVRKFDAQRRLQWQHEFFDGVAYAIAQTSDGGYILSGAHGTAGSLYSNPYALRLDPAGNKLWSRIYSDAAVYVLIRTGVTQTRDGGFLLAAKSRLIRLDGAGSVIWQRRNDAFGLVSVRELPDGAIAVGGTLTRADYDHAYVAVLDATGKSIQWDNTELLFPSGLTQIFLDRQGLVAASGFAPVDNLRSQMLLPVFYPAKVFVQMEGTAEPDVEAATAAA